MQMQKDTLRESGKSHEENLKGQMENKNKINDLNYFAFIYKKTEKLATALYMVTGFFPEDEPLRWQLRKRALGSLSDIMSLRKKTLSSQKKILINVVSSVSEIISLLEVGRISGLVSDMNHRILKKEYGNILDLIDDREGSQYVESNIVLSDKFFEVDSDEKVTPIDEKITSVGLMSGLDRSKNIFSDLVEEEDKKETVDKLKRVVYKKTHNESSKEEEKSKRQNKRHWGVEKDGLDETVDLRGMEVTPLKRDDDELVSVKHFSDNVRNVEQEDPKSKRRARILDVIKDKGEVMIKDVSQVITDCSEKTIQRELVSMLKDNLLKKEGERRWSKYSLNF